MIKQYLYQQDWRVKENSNSTYSFSGLMQHLATSEIAKYTLKEIYPDYIAKAHKDGDLHIHDLGYGICLYCCGWSLEDLIREGLNGVPGKVQSGAAKHLSTLIIQMVNFLGCTQMESAGAQAFNSVDLFLAPFVKIDNLSYKEVKQNIQQLIFSLNIPSRWGSQAPFTNFTFDLVIPEDKKNQPALVGGKFQDFTYGDCQEEVNMINKAFLEIMMEGDYKNAIFNFPIPTYNITPNFDYNSEVAELLWKATAKYGIPYFSNFVNSDMKPSDVRSMCPIDGNEKVLIKSTRGRGLEYVSIGNLGQHNINNYEIYADGKFVKGKFIKYSNQELIKVTLVNGHSLIMTKQHLNYVQLKNNKQTIIVKGQDLSNDMYLPYSLKEYDGEGGNYDLGYLVGCYAGDGSFDRDASVIFSLNKDQKTNVAQKIINISKQYFVSNYTLTEYEDSQLLTLKIHSKALVGLCKDYVQGKERNKHYTAKIFGTSKNFRRGVLEGHLATDGGNRNRIYTSSKKMVETINMLCATLGTTTNVYEDNREGRLGKASNYAVLIYKLNRDNYGNMWYKNNNKLWVKIDKIEQLNTRKDAYCFEVIGDEPMFTVGTTGILTHNCRLRLDLSKLEKRHGGLFGAGDKTGSIGVVTINLPRIGYLSSTKEEYFKRLDNLLQIAKESLDIKRRVIIENMDKGLFPYIKRYLGTIKNHFSTIGIIGMHESLINFMGKSLDTTEGYKFADEIMDYINTRLSEFQIQTPGILYNLEATPAEGTSYRLAKEDTKRFNNIITAGTKTSPYYTNSVHLPVNFSKDIFQVLVIQDEFQTKFTSGTVIHLFVGERIKNTEVIKSIVEKICNNYKLPYFSITPTFSICQEHNYIDGEHYNCPICGKDTLVYSRIVGYYTPTANWNKGKQQEFKERVTYELFL